MCVGKPGIFLSCAKKPQETHHEVGGEAQDSEANSKHRLPTPAIFHAMTQAGT